MTTISCSPKSTMTCLTTRRASKTSAPRRFKPIVLGLLGLMMLAGTACQVRADETPISSGAGPAVVDWPNNHLAMFTLTSPWGAYTGTNECTAITAFVGSKPDTGPTSSQSANWQKQITHDFGFRIKDRLQVIPQPCNKTLIFANDNNKKIWCYTMKASADGSQILNQGDNVEPITISGGFDSYCIIPLPFKTPAPFLSDPTADPELYPMLLVYVQNNAVKCERLDFAWSNEKYQWVLNRSQRNFGVLFPISSVEKKVSACLVPSRDASTAAAFPYNLIVTTILPINDSQSKGVIESRYAPLTADGYPDITNYSDWLHVPRQTMGGPVDGRYVRPTEDVIAYTGIEGRPAVNCLDTNMRPIHYVCDLSQPANQQWQWDGTYGDWWDGANYRWTPTTQYYTSWKATDQTIKTVTGVDGIPATNVNDSSNMTGPYADDHEIIRNVFRYTLGEGQTSSYMRCMREIIFKAHLKPVAFLGKNKMKSLLIGIIEGPPPVPWQNIAISSPGPASVYGSTIVQLTNSTQHDVTTQTSIGLVASTAGAVGVAWDISASVAFQQFGATSAQSVKTTQIECDFKMSGPNVPDDIMASGSAVLLQQDCEVYDCFLTWYSNDLPISGSVTYQQVALKNPHIMVQPYYMSHNHGIIDDQPLYAGKLSTYNRGSSSQLDSYARYGDNSNQFDALSYSWAGNSSAGTQQTLYNSNTTGSGTSFDLTALVGGGTSDASAMVGFTASGSWTWSDTTSQSAMMQSSIGLGLNTNTTDAHVFTQYDYLTYWLKESPDFLTSFRRVLSDTSLSANLQNLNSNLNSQIAYGSAPWVITYSLTGTPTWNPGLHDGNSDIFTLMRHDDRR